MAEADRQQNGRRSYLLNGHPADPRLRSGASSNCNVKQSSSNPICRNFVRGICNQFSKCRYRHEWDLAEIKNQEMIKFCHDYQNNNHICRREGCSYLHASKEEEDLFWSNGILPRILAERHSAMSLASNMNNVNQMYTYMYEPPSLPPLNGVTVGPPPPPPGQLKQVPPPPSSVMLLPPPPPPPPPPPVEPSTSTTAAPPSQVPCPDQGSIENIYSLPSSIASLPKFDASRPPPPLPAFLLKHKAEATAEAGPSKVRKMDSANASGLCINCVQRQLRISIYKQEMERLRLEEEQSDINWKKKLKDFEKGKELLRTLVTPEMFLILNEHIEGAPAVREYTSPPQQEVASMMSKTFMRQMLEFMFGAGPSVEEAAPRREQHGPAERLREVLASLAGASTAASTSWPPPAPAAAAWPPLSAPPPSYSHYSHPHAHSHSGAR